MLCAYGKNTKETVLDGFITNNLVAPYPRQDGSWFVMKPEEFDQENKRLSDQVLAEHNILNSFWTRVGNNARFSDTFAQLVDYVTERDRSSATPPWGDIATEEDTAPPVAPNGRPSNLTPTQHRFVRTPEFKEWFGDWQNDPKNASKVLDNNGEPLVVYHGSPEQITEFQPSTMGELGEGIYLTKNRGEAVKYSEYRLSGIPTVYSMFVNMRTPFIAKKGAAQFWDKFAPTKGTTDAQATLNMIAAGYDGVILTAPETQFNSLTRKIEKTGKTREHLLVLSNSQISQTHSADEAISSPGLPTIMIPENFESPC